MKKLLFLSSLAALLFVGCDDATEGGIDEVGGGVTTEVESVMLSIDGERSDGESFGSSLTRSFYSIDEEDFTLEAVVTADEGCSTKVDWSIDGDCVTFESGVVKVQKAGTTTITATSVADFTKFATLVVSVYAPDITISIPNGYSAIFTVADEKITLDIKSSSIEEAVVWSSTNPDVIKIDSATGEMEFLKAGKSTISAKSGSTTSNLIEITVVEDTDDYSTIGGIETERVEL